MSKQELLKKQDYNFDDLCQIIEILRAPDGCPWDREQNHKSIRKGLIEETYEVVEGIDKGDNKILCEELGDLLLQIVFHAAIAKDEKAFDMQDICTGICKKLIYRHPHVFADVNVENSEQVLSNWEDLKKKEKGQQTDADVLNSVSKALPSLMRAQKLSRKSGEQPELSTVIHSIEKGARELESPDLADPQRLLGDLLFDISRAGNIKRCDLEQALYEKNDRFCIENTKNI